jgi:hypothetical protein
LLKFKEILRNQVTMGNEEIARLTRRTGTHENIQEDQHRELDLHSAQVVT